MIHRTVRVETPFDLNNVCGGDGFLFVRDGVGFAAQGVASTADDATTREILSTSQHSGHHTSNDISDTGPIAFGLVPFLPSASSEFVIARSTFAKRVDGSHTLTLVGESADDVSDAAVATAIEIATNARPPRPSSNSFRVGARTPVGRYLDAVTLARDAVRNGLLKKAVIARDIEVHADEPIDVHSVLLRLRASFGSSYRFCIGNMIGATPELLVEVDGREIRSRPLAGTTPRTGDPDTDKQLAEELVASTKNQIEHRVVVDMVHDTLLPHCSYLDWEAEPSIVTVANVQHLGTYIEGALTEPRAHVMTLVKELCPTPALGGFPSADAIAFITANEPMERGNYGGAVGWMDADGNGTFAVTIRCAELSDDRRTARLFAGGGIVAESNPYAELAETQAKFQAMLSAIVRP
jgi:menaquinone-specific isochorismate synthase